MKTNLAVTAVASIAAFVLGSLWGPELGDRRHSASIPQATPSRHLDHDQTMRRFPGIRPSATHHLDVVCELAACKIGKDAIYDREQFATLLASGGNFRPLASAKPE